MLVCVCGCAERGSWPIYIKLCCRLTQASLWRWWCSA